MQRLTHNRIDQVASVCIGWSVKAAGAALLLGSLLVAVLAAPITMFRVWLSGDRTEAARFLNDVERRTLKVVLLLCAAVAPLGAVFWGSFGQSGR